MNVSRELNDIEEKVQQLSRLVTQLRHERAALLAENNELKSAFDRQKEEIAALQNTLESARPQPGEQTSAYSGPPQDIRAQIDHYLREIDKCIAWLQQQ